MLEKCLQKFDGGDQEVGDGKGNELEGVPDSCRADHQQNC